MGLDKSYLGQTMLGFSLIVLLAIAACTESSPLPSTNTPGAEAPAQATATSLPPLGAEDSQAIVVNAPTLMPDNEAVIDTVEILLLETPPAQVNAVIKGKLPDACVTIERINQQLVGNAFIVTIVTHRQPDVGCIAQLQPFEETLPLEVAGLPTGAYTVTVRGTNSVSSTFELSGAETQPALLTPAPSPPLASAAISGVVWADFCQLLENGSPSGGCLPDGSGGYRADALFNNGEMYLVGVQVALRAGECSGSGPILAIATTAADGLYRFDNLQPGPYCVFIDALVEPNLSLLLPGAWTYPAPNLGRVTLVVGAGENKRADFGWDDQFERAPAQSGPCLDQVTFVADVTIPDNTPLAPGAPFVKTWRVRNTGTCLWGQNYALVFVGGAAMGGPAAVPLPQPVPPGAEVDLSISRIAPTNPGVYRGEWKLQNSQGILFSSQENYPFYVQIVVAGVTETLTPPTLSISGLVWDDFCQLLETGLLSGGCILAGPGGQY
ncbi:MAG TPA: NBR1-Ig-like domain-containing protein, partial [Anaerolineae bacterium]|nr:NBR1-Ig-like domain-containing protein [Anaerolineae bacterium]